MIGKILGIATLASLALGAAPASAQSAYEERVINDAMDKIIALDSGSWLPWYEYARGSAQSSRILDTAPDGSVAVIRTYFRYRSGSSDYVTMTIAGDRGILCLRYESVSSPCTLAVTPDYKMWANGIDLSLRMAEAISNSSN
jgi:hypothetical protein